MVVLAKYILYDFKFFKIVCRFFLYSKCPLTVYETSLLYNLSFFKPRGTNPIGLNPISSNSKNIKNYDVSYTVKGHFEYKKNLQTILKNLEL